ncbi:hypothetical protein [Oceaniglobus roseus]|uniref:hypothetical protein n=1 Tax=Oceaniglobus roseus TaxID=1737570 RepID=UPI000C7F5C62|nr:hypothetical protein [Kandeliimicrobium roseum]
MLSQIPCRLALAAAVTLAVASAAPASPFDGRYKPAPTSDCTVTGAEGGVIEIEGNTFTGVEAVCDMTRATNVRDMNAVLYDMACKSADTEWTRRAMLMQASDGGLILVWDGFAFKYDICPKDPAANTVTTPQDVGITD